MFYYYLDQAKHEERFSNLKRRRLQPQSLGFLKTEHNIQILHGLSGRSLDKIVDDRGDVYIFPVHLQMQESLVGVHHILERNVAVAVENERGVEIVL